MSPQLNKSGLDLRRMFPDLALQMDTQLILHQARDLGINPHVNKSRKLPVLRVQLSLSHELLISPVDKGAMGIAEWFTFAQPCKCPDRHPEMITRVHVSIKDKLFQQINSESFTIEAPNFEMILRISLSIYYSSTGKKLQPIINTSRHK